MSNQKKQKVIIFALVISLMFLMITPSFVQRKELLLIAYTFNIIMIVLAAIYIYYLDRKKK